MRSCALAGGMKKENNMQTPWDNIVISKFCFSCRKKHMVYKKDLKVTI